MQNKENIFEKNNKGFEQTFKELPKKEAVESEDFINYEKVEEELSFLFKESKDKIIEENRGDDKESSPEINKKIDDLLALAFVKSPEEAIKKASSFNDPFLLDEFHDRLIDELRKRKLN